MADRTRASRLPLDADNRYHSQAMQPANDEPETLRVQLQELRIEHRDLDEAIERLEAAPPHDELLLRRMKKRKLQLKDRITAIEHLLEPNELA
jgi:hypothetical protein